MLCLDDSRRIRNKEEYGSTDADGVCRLSVPSKTCARNWSVREASFHQPTVGKATILFVKTPESDRRIEKEPFYFRMYGYRRGFD